MVASWQVCVLAHLGCKDRAIAACVSKTINLAGSQDASSAFQQLHHETHRFRSRLQHVILQFAVGITDKHVAWLQQFSTITDLNLDACHGYDPCICTAHTVLQHVCHRVSDAQLQRLLPALPALQMLSLYWQPAVTDRTLFLMAAFNTHLRRLTLSGCQQTTDAGLATVATACRQLTYLDLTRCTSVSRTTCTAVGNCCTGLQTLLLYANAAVDDACLAAIATLPVGVFMLLLQHCLLQHPVQRLRELDICGARLVTDAGLQSLAACTALIKVNLTWVPQVTDAGVVPLVRACRLQWLSLHGNTHITDAVVEVLAEGVAETLVALDLGGCIGVVRRSPQELVQCLPRLRCFKLHS